MRSETDERTDGRIGRVVCSVGWMRLFLYIMHLSLKSLNSLKSLKCLKYLKSLNPRKDTDVTAASTHEHSLAPHQVEFGHSLALHQVEFGHRQQHYLGRCGCRGDTRALTGSAPG